MKQNKARSCVLSLTAPATATSTSTSAVAPGASATTTLKAVNNEADQKNVSGNSQPFSIIPPYTVVNCIIAVQGIYPSRP